ncbi:regulatory protein GemA [Sphingomonas sp. CROZ-RG-20F-R02-07]|uniref:gp16 family protein n=1 Tax=Sphingomonas sp. CROZ-RG-20F-R02-07 TaxID=2914832 RepID=UPI001F592B82|nr:regulatory protein GemA [Sphingomonas sp. CROZ-RG-20F-R02-07]
MKAAAAPARFDRADQHRRSMLAKVHIAKKTLGLTDDDYRAVMLRVTGRVSAGDCSSVELDKLLKEFETKGFSAKARTGPARPADHPAAKKARALWISLYHLGAIDDPSEHALETIARRMLRIDRLQWANQALAYKLIEALKAIGDRHGWNQSIEGVAVRNVPVVLRRRLVETIMGKLKAEAIIPADWSLTRAAYDLGGIRFEGLMLAGVEDLDLVAQALGAKLRAVRDAR